jgi:UDP-N-acetyl-D-glucosamine dehydrogenase
MHLLEAKGAVVDYHDPYVPEIAPTREHAEYAGRQSVDWSERTVSSYDCILVSTPHKAVDYQALAKWAPCVVDTRNVVAGAVKA